MGKVLGRGQISVVREASRDTALDDIAAAHVEHDVAGLGESGAVDVNHGMPNITAVERVPGEAVNPEL